MPSKRRAPIGVWLKTIGLMKMKRASIRPVFAASLFWVTTPAVAMAGVCLSHSAPLR